MNLILEQIQKCAASLPLSAQAELLNYAIYLEQKSQEQTPTISTQTRRDRLAAALAQSAILNPFAEINDPVAWQREQRHDRPLPGRDHVN
jgi:hypothetical protein